MGRPAGYSSSAARYEAITAFRAAVGRASSAAFASCAALLCWRRINASIVLTCGSPQRVARQAEQSSTARPQLQLTSRRRLRAQKMLLRLRSWLPLGAPPSEVRLDFTLPTGQSFRWRRTGEQEYTGVVHRRVVRY